MSDVPRGKGNLGVPSSGPEPPGGGERTHVDAEASFAQTVATGAGSSAGGASAALAPSAGGALGPGSLDLVPGTMVGEYRIEGKLGEGGMGQVFAAVHPLIGKRAAIKVIRLELCANVEVVERFVQEARAVNQIGHPNIVDVFAFGSLADGRRYLVMEWLKGESVAARLRRGPMSLDEICDVLEPVTRALEAAHDKRIIHRDLKPDNLFLVAVKGEKPMVKLLDFGIAKLEGTDDTRLERTRTGSMLGTPQYISPEQARGRTVDERTDVYSLGCMAFEMFTGRPPFVADNAMDMVSQHLHDPAPAARSVVPELPDVLDALLAAMLDKDANKRPSLEAVRAAFAETRRAKLTTRTTVTAPASATAPGLGTAATVAHGHTPLPRAAPAAPAMSSASGAAALARGMRPSRRGLWVSAFLLVGGAAVLIGWRALSAPRAATTTTEAAPVPAPGLGPAPKSPVPVGTPLLVADAGAQVRAPAPAVEAGAAALAARGALVLELNVVDARVLVDGEAVAVTAGTGADRDRGSARVLLAPGPHVVEISAPGRKPWRRDVTTGDGEVRLKARLERDSAAVRPPPSGTPAGEPTPPPTNDIKPPPAAIEPSPIDDEGTVDPFKQRKKPT